MSSSIQTAKAVRGDFRWDVFLSYRSPDRNEVEEVAKKLVEMGLRVWWDEQEIPPGARYMDHMWEGLKSSFATIVFISPATVGNWQEMEAMAAIATQVAEKRPVLPVFLPGIPDPNKVDLGFLGLNSRAVFENTVTEQRVLNRIYWGITGNKPDVSTTPVQPNPTPPRVTAPSDGGSIAWLARWLRKGTVTFFVGPGASEVGSALPPRNWEIACELLKEIGLIDAEPDHLLPPVDVAAAVYAVSNTDPVLEETVVSLIQNRSTSIPPTHRRLAELIAKLSKREGPRSTRIEKQLILTTNIDLLMERALLAQNLRPTRIVQHRSEPRLHFTDYRGIARVPSDTTQLDELIAGTESTRVSPDLATGSLIGEPVLYKTRGSQDIAGSCALTRPQLLAQARSLIAEHLIPDGLTKIAVGTPIVFLGTGLLDSDFDYISHTVLYNAWESGHPKYLVHPTPDQDTGDGYRRMEAGRWEQIRQLAMRRNLITVEMSSERFLERLLEAI